VRSFELCQGCRVASKNQTKAKPGVAGGPIGVRNRHPSTHADPIRIQRFLKRAEDLPFEQRGALSKWLEPLVLESVTTLTYAAAITKRLRLGIAVLLIAQRNPIDLAKALASWMCFQWRLIVGVGLGASTSSILPMGLMDAVNERSSHPRRRLRAGQPDRPWRRFE